jgi:hypothetical protein
MTLHVTYTVATNWPHYRPEPMYHVEYPDGSALETPRGHRHGRRHFLAAVRGYVPAGTVLLFPRGRRRVAI